MTVEKESNKIVFCGDLLDDVIGLAQVLALACNSQELTERTILEGEQRGLSVICMLLEEKVAIINKSRLFMH
ncbi:MAG: hypothetical protein LBL65_03605 [Campylobacteraceae bacterium]|nr:hypothetical protein [Campylobacteraceae bacterium]